MVSMRNPKDNKRIHKVQLNKLRKVTWRNQRNMAACLRTKMAWKVSKKCIKLKSIYTLQRKDHQWILFRLRWILWPNREKLNNNQMVGKKATVVKRLTPFPTINKMMSRKSLLTRKKKNKKSMYHLSCQLLSIQLISLL